MYLHRIEITFQVSDWAYIRHLFYRLCITAQSDKLEALALRQRNKYLGLHAWGRASSPSTKVVSAIGRPDSSCFSLLTARVRAISTRICDNRHRPCPAGFSQLAGSMVGARTLSFLATLPLLKNAWKALQKLRLRLEPPAHYLRQLGLSYAYPRCQFVLLQSDPDPSYLELYPSRCSHCPPLLE